MPPCALFGAQSFPLFITLRNAICAPFILHTNHNSTIQTFIYSNSTSCYSITRRTKPFTGCIFQIHACTARTCVCIWNERSLVNVWNGASNSIDFNEFSATIKVDLKFSWFTAVFMCKGHLTHSSPFSPMYGLLLHIIHTFIHPQMHDDLFICYKLIAKMLNMHAIMSTTFNTETHTSALQCHVHMYLHVHQEQYKLLCSTCNTQSEWKVPKDLPE